MGRLLLLLDLGHGFKLRERERATDKVVRERGIQGGGACLVLVHVMEVIVDREIGFIAVRARRILAVCGAALLIRVSWCRNEIMRNSVDPSRFVRSFGFFVN